MDQVKNPTQIHFKRQVVQDKYRNVPKDYMRVAKGMEAQFTNHLLGEMRKTVHSANPETQAERIYKSMLDDERAQMMADSNSGLGVKDLVLDQIYPQYKQRNPQQALNTYQQVTSHKGENNE